MKNFLWSPCARPPNRGECRAPEGVENSTLVVSQEARRQAVEMSSWVSGHFVDGHSFQMVCGGSGGTARRIGTD